LRTPSPKPTLYGQIFQQNVWIGFILLAGMTLGFSAGL
ncbi:MAG: 4-hydroxybenzoate octaprenyltransferase, partial [Oculatellaceae cyanobacterium Prado106]|nr:4-hydroxybenzoate octaprenyltransferase [Oculatellaceae cyanobacterium Prado106]